MARISLLMPFLILQLLVINFASASFGDGGINIRIVGDKMFITDSYEYFPGQTINDTNITIDSISVTLSPVTCNKTVLIWNETTQTNMSYQTECYINMDLIKSIRLKDAYLNFIRNSSTNCTNITGFGNYELVNKKSQEELELCLTDKATIFGNHQALANEYGAINKTNELYVKCNADFAVCQNEKTTKDAEITKLNTNINESKNTKWIYAVIAFVVGIVGYSYYIGKIGGQKVKQSGENYQKGQSA